MDSNGISAENCAIKIKVVSQTQPQFCNKNKSSKFWPLCTFHPWHCGKAVNCQSTINPTKFREVTVYSCLSPRKIGNPPKNTGDTREVSISTQLNSTHLVLQDPTSQLGEKPFVHQFTWLAPESPNQSPTREGSQGGGVLSATAER